MQQRRTSISPSSQSLNAETVQLMKAKRDIILTEAQIRYLGLQANWRPITILCLNLLQPQSWHMFGVDEGLAGLWGGHGITDELASQFLDIVMVSVGGYIGHNAWR